MPNGRSGGFPLETADLKQLIAETSGATAIGMLISRSSQPGPATASEVSELVAKCLHPRLAVEEQYGDSYIIHISNEPDFIWVAVGSESPLFAALRRRHTDWETAHPGWDGWMAF